MTGNPTLDTVLIIAIGVGAAIASAFSVIVAVIVYVKPRIDGLFKPTVKAATAAAVEAANDTSKTTSKQTAEDLLAEWGRDHLEDLEKRVEAAESERTTLIGRLDQIDADAAARAAKDQATIQRLENDVKLLTTKVTVLETERGKILSDRDAALRRADELAKDVDRLKDASTKSTEQIHKLEIELTKQSTTNQVLQGIFDKVHWLGVQNEAPKPEAAPA